MEKIKVYSKENCVQCTATERRLGRMGIKYEVIMLEGVPDMVEEFKSEGLMQAPIVDTGEERWSGFRPDKLKELGEE